MNFFNLFLFTGKLLFIFPIDLYCERDSYYEVLYFRWELKVSTRCCVHEKTYSTFNELQCFNLYYKFQV